MHMETNKSKISKKNQNKSKGTTSPGETSRALHAGGRLALVTLGTCGGE